jgi:hypothetical protein
MSQAAAPPPPPAAQAAPPYDTWLRNVGSMTAKYPKESMAHVKQLIGDVDTEVGKNLQAVELLVHQWEDLAATWEEHTLRLYEASQQMVNSDSEDKTALVHEVALLSKALQKLQDDTKVLRDRTRASLGDAANRLQEFNEATDQNTAENKEKRRVGRQAIRARLNTIVNNKRASTPPGEAPLKKTRPETGQAMGFSAISNLPGKFPGYPRGTVICAKTLWKYMCAKHHELSATGSTAPSIFHANTPGFIPYVIGTSGECLVPGGVDHPSLALADSQPYLSEEAAIHIDDLRTEMRRDVQRRLADKVHAPVHDESSDDNEEEEDYDKPWYKRRNIRPV